MISPVLVFITDARHSRAETVRAIGVAAEAVGRGRLVVQLRDKQASESELMASAAELLRVTRQCGARLVINGSLTVACAVGADGVHFPNAGERSRVAVEQARIRLGSEAFVTTTAHDDDDVRHAISAGAAAVLVSPIFATPGKSAPRGVAVLAAARAIVAAASAPTQVYALGGVTCANIEACLAAGADGAAAIRAVYDGDSRALGEAFDRAGRRWTP